MDNEQIKYNIGICLKQMGDDFIKNQDGMLGARVSPGLNRDDGGNGEVTLGTQLDEVNDKVTNYNDDYSLKYQAAAGANVVVKASAGYLKAIILGKWVTNGVLEVSDHASDGDGNIKIKITAAATNIDGFPKVIPVNASFAVGICADIVGFTDCTFIFR